MPPEANDARPPHDPPPLWTGLEEYMNSPAFRDAMANEFPDQASEWTDPVTRRNFLTLMGASLAMAGVVGCSPRPAPQRKIMPYTRQPDQITPGVPLLFATAFPLAGFGAGVLVRSHEGRPVKVEGNPDHPSSLGGTDVFAQASILGMYDPDRSQRVTKGGGPSTYMQAVQAVRDQLDAAKGAKVRVLTGTVTSPTLAAQLKGLLDQLPGAKWAVHEPAAADNARDGTRRAFGRPLNVTYDFAAADVVLSLDADFLGVGPGGVRYSRDFASRRKVRSAHFFEHVEEHHKEAHKTGAHHDHDEAEQYSTVDAELAKKHELKTLNRLYVVECMPTSTGSVADHRLPLLASQVEAFGRAVAAGLGVAGVPAAGALPEAAQKWVAPLVADLKANAGKSIVVAGDHQPASVHALALAINNALGNVGKTVTLSAPVEAHLSDDFKGQVIGFADLVNEMAAGAVETLLILGTNPAVTAPVDVPFTTALEKVPFKLHLGLYQDETAVLCDWHVNEAYYLESWGDVRGHDGTAAIQQPLIAPLYAGKSALEFVAAVSFNPARLNVSTDPAKPTPPTPATEGLDIVKAFWSRTDAVTKVFPGFKRAGEFEPFWQEVVRTGVVKGTESAPVTAALGNWAADAPPASPTPPADAFEINFRIDPTLFDGRFANNGWLQELPRPVSKLTWDNAAFVGTGTGKRLGIEKEFRWTAGEHGRAEVSVVEIEYKGRKVKAPVWILPGHAENAVTVHVGAGRERAGRVANSPSEPNAEGKPVRGFNAYVLRDSQTPWIATGAKLTKTSGGYFLACIQGGGLTTGTKDPLTGKPTNDRRPARRATAQEYREKPNFAKLPPTAVGETQLIDENVPGSGSDHKHNGNGHGHEHGHEEHDHRLHPLTMYHPNEKLFPDLPPDRQRKWGMAIDLGACTGCNACMVACQSENNIPVVGKREVTRGHEMLWIRVDRYYGGNPEDPAGVETHFQPVPCQQCEKAPCEVVCPVGATVHSTDGLNDMVYNRCVGTRYCSNNCPYKVRRFNFLTFQDWATESLKLGRNPDVSVRSRGVMEKCTYCVQRIRYAEIAAEREHRGIRDGEVVTACQSACPSGAIMFGDLLADHSKVAEWKAEPTNYGLLAELNTMPRTSYLAGVRNPNPNLPK
jgi:molybdopterin-containing oxidoreductase family iron-sulfur binding subunit